MITGRLPFSGRSSLEVLMKHANEPVPPPQSVVPHLDRGVCDVILRMMAKNPADRFRSYDDVRDALIEADIAQQSAASGLDDRPPR
jgi:serine/threonine-protein kinase